MRRRLARYLFRQAADELLSIIGTHASVVAFRSGNDMAVSARAAGHVNVQLLMERLGGGGNHSAAGAQLKNTTPEEADKLIATLEAQGEKAYRIGRVAKTGEDGERLVLL